MRRLTFTYRDGTVELESDQQVQMTMPAQPPIRTQETAGSGFWYELRDADDEVSHRIDAPDPIPTDIEVFSDDPERTIERVDAVPRSGVFTVLIPEIEQAREIALVRSAASSDAGAPESRVEIGRFALRPETED